MDRFDVFVIGGGGTGSEVAFRLGGRRVCASPSPNATSSAASATTTAASRRRSCCAARRSRRSPETRGRFGVRIPSVTVDLPAVQQRARDVIEAQSGEGAAPFERAGIRVFMQEAVLDRTAPDRAGRRHAGRGRPRRAHHRHRGRRSRRSTGWRTGPSGRTRRRSGSRRSLPDRSRSSERERSASSSRRSTHGSARMSRSSRPSPTSFPPRTRRPPRRSPRALEEDGIALRTRGDDRARAPRGRRMAGRARGERHGRDAR